MYSTSSQTLSQLLGIVRTKEQLATAGSAALHSYPSKYRGMRKCNQTQLPATTAETFFKRNHAVERGFGHRSSYSPKLCFEEARNY